MAEIRIDAEFRGLLRPLTEEERAQLEASLLEDGCLDPLIVWEQEGILLDGHHRHEICEREGLDYKRARLSFDSREEAIAWVKRKQAGRRNLTAAQISYLRGNEYRAQKKTRGRPKKMAQTALFSETQGATADNLAEKHGIDQATIRRDAEFAEALDAARPEVKAAILNGEAPKTAAFKPPPEAATDDMARDGWGVPIQPHAANAFEAQPLFDELISLLRKADKLYSQLAEHEGGAYLLRPGISINARDRWKHKGIQSALMNVQDCKPTYTVCPRAYHLLAFPDCHDQTPHSDKCTLCHGLNWSRPLSKTEVATEVVAKIKEEFGVEQ